MCMFVCPKNNSQTVNVIDLKFAHVILCAIRRSTVLFSNFNFQVLQNRTRVLNSRANESKEQCAPVRSDC